MMKRISPSLLWTLLLALGIGAVLTSPSVWGQAPARPVVPPPAPAPGAIPEEATLELKFENAPLVEMVLEAYAEKTGRTLLLNPGLPKVNVTLRSQSMMTPDEYLMAIESVAGMNGVALLRVGEKFLKVLPSKDARVGGIDTVLTEPEGGQHVEDGQTISQMITLKHIDIQEAQKALEGFKSPAGKLQVFERTNSILVTDLADNINRMIEVVHFIDQPVISREEVNVLQVHYAKAADIKKTLEEIVAESQKEQQSKQKAPVAKAAGSPGIVARPVPGVIRAPSPGAAEPVNNETISALMEDAERGVIRGKVQIVADERTNLLIIITRPSNMAFFDKIIRALDVETTPDVLVEVFRLKHADSDEVASMLNDLIGNQKQAKDAPAAVKAEAGNATAADARSKRLAEYVESLRSEAAKTTADGGGSPGDKSSVGTLNKENIKILSNKRTNAIIVMASKSDMKTLNEIIEDMDIMLSQVLIETAVLQIDLTDGLQTGIDWVQRSMIGYTGSGASRTPVVAYAGQGGGALNKPVNPLDFTSAGSFPQRAGLTYYTTFFDLNMDAVLHADARDSRSRILASPIIMTQDNKEASIEATTRQYFYNGKKYVGGGTDNPVYEDDVKQEDIGLKLKVLPRINEKGLVVLNVEQNIENISGEQIINGTSWPIVTSRKVSAEVAVNVGDTIALGGLVLNSARKARSKIPLLGDIPLLGWLFRTTSIENERVEVLIFLTPFVQDTPEAQEREARRRKSAIDAGDIWGADWSGSRLATGADDPDEGRPAVLNNIRVIPSVQVEEVERIMAPEEVLESLQPTGTNRVSETGVDTLP